MSIERRLRGLEEYATPKETPAETEKRRKEIREAAEHANRCRDHENPPIFEITENGGVLCARDGRPVTNFQQTLAEEWYWQELEWGAPGLVHDEEAQAFYTQSGELALSRDRVDLQRLMGKDRDEAWEGEG
jgi:hypothetical protein